MCVLTVVMVVVLMNIFSNGNNLYFFFALRNVLQTNDF